MQLLHEVKAEEKARNPLGFITLIERYRSQIIKGEAKISKKKKKAFTAKLVFQFSTRTESLSGLFIRGFVC